MLRLAALIWLIAGTVLAGAAITVVVATPALAVDAFRLIPWVGIGGFVVAVPVAYIVTRALLRPPALPGR